MVLLFNYIYTNDQLVAIGTNNYMYADNRSMVAQGKTFEEVERHLTEALVELDWYYCDKQLSPNPAKTQVYAFHVSNKQKGTHYMKRDIIGALLQP